MISEMAIGDRRPIEEWGHDAQWADEFHHALHVLLTGERDGLLRAATARSPTLRAAYEDEPAERLVVCAQNHDQVGNRALGDRLPPDVAPRWPRPACSSPRRCRCSSWARSTARRAPFQFFTDHDDPAIAEATREGRRKEFAQLRGVRARGGPRPAGPRDVRALASCDPESGDDELRAFYAS